MSYIHEIANTQGNKSVVDTVNARTIVDTFKTSGESFKVSDKVFKYERAISSNLTGLGAYGVEHVISIPVSERYVSNLSLEIAGTTADATTNATDYNNWAIQTSLIKKVKIVIGDTTMCEYTGSDLVKIITYANRSSPTNIIELNSLAGSGNVGCEATTLRSIPMITPLLGPGSNCIYSLDAFDQRNPAFPLGGCNQPMDIRITTQASSYGTSKPLTITYVKLRYISYSAEGVPDVANKSVSTGIFSSWVYSKPITYTLGGQSLTDGTIFATNIDPVISQGELDGVCVSLLQSTMTSALKFTDYAQIDKLQLLCRSTDVMYNQDNMYQGRLNSMREMKIPNKIYGSTAKYGYVYYMALTNRPDLSGISGNYGTKGVDLNINRPLVQITLGTNAESPTGTYDLQVLAFYKCEWGIYNNKNSYSKTSFQ